MTPLTMILATLTVIGGLCMGVLLYVAYDIWVAVPSRELRRTKTSDINYSGEK